MILNLYFEDVAYSLTPVTDYSDFEDMENSPLMHR